ncbi:hypothetical protein CAP35_05430 [Chitinophagaceae bacterium IBVUCB1]|nr:hypothetical protein CAP35_05430 [Chitinophagaceae bacterium IBVUCB1]
MEKQAKEISDILKDYHSDRDNGFTMTHENVISWVQQFQVGDRSFILDEFLHILNQGVYVSKHRAKDILLGLINHITETWKYGSVKECLSETFFLCQQPKHKSQCILLKLLDDVIKEKFEISLDKCGAKSKKNIVYIDDVLSTGRTVLKDCRKFMEGKDFHNEGNLKGVKSGKIRYAVAVFCKHLWACDNIKYSLSKTFNDDWFLNNLTIFSHYSIENNTRSYNPKLNMILPLDGSSKIGVQYLSALEAQSNEKYAWRAKGQPKNETLFSNTDNRVRFEGILLETGITILSKVKNLGVGIRPLGCTYPHYKTFGTGTLFFSWNNISNTCPLVFWWDNPAHGWKGLFPLNHRGT